MHRTHPIPCTEDVLPCSLLRGLDEIAQKLDLAVHSFTRDFLPTQEAQTVVCLFIAALADEPACVKTLVALYSIEACSMTHQRGDSTITKYPAARNSGMTYMMP